MGENIALRYHFHLQKVGRQYLAITTGEEARLFPQLIYLNEAGAEICRIIQEQSTANPSRHTTPTAILDTLCDIYDAPRQDLSECLGDVLDHLRHSGALYAT